MPYIQKRIDPGQFGGLRGHSTSHYMITLLDFILSHTDTSRVPAAVMVALIDFSKAFNRINHNKVIVRLSDWGVPGWLLRILISYLSGRSMILRYKGAQSSRHWMPGGSPQGTLLGVLLYLVYVSDIGMDLPSVTPTVPGVIDLPSVPYPPPAAVSNHEARLKFVDDLSLAECVSLNSRLASDGDKLWLPASNSTLQSRLNEIVMAADYHDMKLNLDKTKIISFNFTRNYKFEPQLTLDGEALDVVEETKLLGLTITSDCKWNKNVKNTKAKGNGRLWFLRRLKLLGAKEDTMIEIYKLFCRSVLEYCAPVWSGALTKANTEDIERVQRNALKIIMGASYVNYEECLDQINEQTLKERHDQLCLRFAESCLKNDKFSSWFQKGVNTRSGSYFLEPVSKTNRYRNSAIPHLTRLLNCRK